MLGIVKTCSNQLLHSLFTYFQLSRELLFHLANGSLCFTWEVLSPPLVQVRVSDVIQLFGLQKVHLEYCYVEDVL